MVKWDTEKARFVKQVVGDAKGNFLRFLEHQGMLKTKAQHYVLVTTKSNGLSAIKIKLFCSSGQFALPARIRKAVAQKAEYYMLSVTSPAAKFTFSKS